MTAIITWETDTANAGKPMDPDTVDSYGNGVFNDADLQARAQLLRGRPFRPGPSGTLWKRVADAARLHDHRGQIPPAA